MDKKNALQNLLRGKATKKEVDLLKQALVTGEISIGGNISNSVIIQGSENNVQVFQLTPEMLELLGGHQLLGNLGRDLNGNEIALGLERLEVELSLRAPVLTSQFQEQARRLRPTLKTNPNSLSESARKNRLEALAHINSLCMETLDISFNAVATGEALPEYEARCPFRGLESFRVEDKEFFFGREKLTQKLVGKIQSHSFLAVLGSSGSGKSSLVMAGMIPILDLDYAIIRPGERPLDALNSALAKPLLVVDQFEELFTLTRNDQTREEFISVLLDFAKSGKVIITLRSDFLGEAGVYRSLSGEIQNHLEIIPPMNVDELRRAMEGQARWARLEFEADLSQQILDDVAGEPGAMPLLQHALWELWNRRHGQHLRANEYRAFGGVKQAITSTVEKVYGDCSKPEQEQVRDIFLRLTRLDEGDERRDTRRRVSLGELIPSGADAASISSLLDKLANARLIVKIVNNNKTEIEVAHEALISHWERLRNWADDNRRFLIWRQKINDRCLDWQINKGELLQGLYLVEAENWFVEKKDLLSSDEKKYIEESIVNKNKQQIMLRNINFGFLLSYVLLLIVVGSVGLYITTRLITGSLTERVTNQLLEAGRVVSDSFVRQENQHVREAFLIIYTDGLVDAVLNQDREKVLELVKPLFSYGTVESLLIISPQGNEVIYLHRDQNGELFDISQGSTSANWQIAELFLVNQDPNLPPMQSIRGNPVDGEAYYYTTLPISVDGEFYGVISLGTSIKTLFPTFKQIALADIILYANNGRAIASTIGAANQDTLEQLNISSDQYSSMINYSEDLVTGSNIEIDGRTYTIGLIPLQVGSNRIGVFAIALPLDYVVQFANDNRTVYVVLFSTVFTVLLLIVFFVWQKLFAPLYRLMENSNDHKKNTKSKQRFWLALFSILPLGILLFLITGLLATRIVPFWSVNATTNSSLSLYNLPSDVNILKPISSEILTPPIWVDTYLTPNSEVTIIAYPSAINIEKTTTPPSLP